MGEDAVDAVPALMEIFDSPCGHGNYPCTNITNAIIAFGNIAGATQDIRIREAISILEDTLVITDYLYPEAYNEPDIYHRSRAEAALALGKIGQNTDTIVPILIRAMGDIDKDVRQNALLALGMLGVNTHDLILELSEDLGDQNVAVQRRTALSLATIGPYAVPTLLTALGDESPRVQIGAAYALGNLEFSNREIIEALQEIIEDEGNEFELRRIAASSLELLDQDMHQFFERHNVVNPNDAVCPEITYGGLHDTYEYDLLTGKCQFRWETGWGGPGGGLIARLTQFYNGVKQIGGARQSSGGQRPRRGPR